MGMPLTPNPPLNLGGSPDVDRPQPTDAPGSMAGAWSKGCTSSPGGWDMIDDVPGADDAGWRQC